MSTPGVLTLSQTATRFVAFGLPAAAFVAFFYNEHLADQEKERVFQERLLEQIKADRDFPVSRDKDEYQKLFGRQLRSDIPKTRT